MSAIVRKSRGNIKGGNEFYQQYQLKVEGRWMRLNINGRKKTLVVFNLIFDGFNQ